MPVSVTIILALLIIIFILEVSLYVLYKRGKEDKYKISELERELKLKEMNISYLFKHAEELATIVDYNSELKGKIAGAKTDEEVNNIISAIISANNDRVQNNKADTK